MKANVKLPTEKTGSLTGHLLIATSVVDDSIFARSVIYMCAHNAEGAMGVIINYPVQEVEMDDILDQLHIEGEADMDPLPVHFGGPVEANRGFIVHSADQPMPDSIICKNGIAVTASLSILQQIAQGRGPEKGMLVLGYAGWSSGQLESEIEQGSWLVVPATRALVFDTDNDTKWSSALSVLGIDMGHFSTDVGHA